VFKDILKISFYTITVSLAISVALPHSEISAQGNLKIFDDIGGGNGTTEQSSSSDNTFIYVIGGIVVASIVAYALFIKKVDDMEKSDTSTALIEKLLISNSVAFRNESEIEKVKDQVPVDIYFGVTQNDAIQNDKRYLLGVSVRF
jgi:hypothetical protein